VGPGGESTVVGVEVKLRAEDIGVEGVEDGGNGGRAGIAEEGIRVL